MTLGLDAKLLSPVIGLVVPGGQARSARGGPDLAQWHLSLLFAVLHRLGAPRGWSVGQQSGRDYLKHRASGRLWTRSRRGALWSLTERRRLGPRSR